LEVHLPAAAHPQKHNFELVWQAASFPGVIDRRGQIPFLQQRPIVGLCLLKCLMSTVYDVIKAAADKYGVPVNTMLAFGQIESQFDPNAYNASHAAQQMRAFPF
jgi:hypothetical protein